METDRLRSPLLIGLLCMVAAAVAGCVSQSPWTSTPNAPKPAGPAAQASSETAQGGSPISHASADSKQMQQVMAELQRLGDLDPAARDQLTADLQQTDPALWPGLLHQARAVAAYRQRAAYPPHNSQEPAAGTPDGFAAGPGAMADDRALAATPVAREASFASNPVRRDDPASPPIHRLPVPSQAALAPDGAPGEHYPTTGFPPSEASPESGIAAPTSVPAQEEEAPSAEPPRAAPDAAAGTDVPSPEPETSGPRPQAEGRLASYSTESPLDWTGHVDSAIELLEKASTNTADEEIRLRMLYLAARRYDDAVQTIPALPPGEQEFWTAKFHGLGTLLDEAKNPDAPSRRAEAKQVLADAASKLGELAPLVVRNLAFCTRVHSYGCFEAFPSYKFTPEQRVLLYAEVDNFTSESNARGYHTSLKSSYQLFDARGQRVADEELASTEEVCQNRRRDFFIVYDFHLPQRVYPGKHTLRLTIEDLKGQKIGDSSIDLEIVAESGSQPR